MDLVSNRVQDSCVFSVCWTNEGGGTSVMCQNKENAGGLRNKEGEIFIVQRFQSQIKQTYCGYLCLEKLRL